MYPCSQTFSVDFLQLLKRQHLKNLKKSPNKFLKDKKFNIFIKKEIIDSNIELDVPKHPTFVCYIFRHCY